MTLNDLEWRNSPYFVLFHRILYLCRPVTSQWLMVDLYCLTENRLPLLAKTDPPCSAVSAIAELLVDHDDYWTDLDSVFRSKISPLVL